MSVNQIRFHNKYRTKILQGEKTCTVRYGWDDAMLPEVGSSVILRATDVDDHRGFPFAVATIDWIDSMTIEEFVEESWEGHKEYDNVEDMVWALGHFYDDPMDAETGIDVIGWRDVEEYER
jgi:hypothetical protein